MWISSKTNSEFFTASTDGTVMWWDIRQSDKTSKSIPSSLTKLPSKQKTKDATSGRDIIQTFEVQQMHRKVTTQTETLIIRYKRNKKIIWKLKYTGWFFNSLSPPLISTEMKKSCSMNSSSERTFGWLQWLFFILALNKGGPVKKSPCIINISENSQLQLRPW